MATLVDRNDRGIAGGAAIIAGIVAVVVFAIVEIAFSWAMRGQSPWHPLVVFGNVTVDVFMPGRIAGGGPRTIAAGIALLVVLGALSGLILAYVVDRVGAVTAAVTGAIFGLAMFAIDLYALARVFPVLADLRDWMSALAYAIEGALAAGLYKAATHHERPLAEPSGPDLRDLRHAPLA